MNLTGSEFIAKSLDYQPLLREATFLQSIATFELFLQDLLRLWLTAYPRSIGRPQVEFANLLDAADLDAINQSVIDRELFDVLSKRSAALFVYLERLARLSVPYTHDIERFSEAIAARNVLVHNRGIANAAYRTKAGPRARFAEGDPVEIDGPYYRSLYEWLLRLVAELSNAAIIKAS